MKPTDTKPTDTKPITTKPTSEQSMWQKIGRLLLPRACPGCKRSLGEAQGICLKCRELWQAQITDYSPLREVRIPHLVFLGDFTLEIRRTVLALKFAGSREVAEVLAQILAPRVPAWWNITQVVAVPLHRRRQAQRGYNQSEILALEVAKLLQKPYQNALERTRATRQQAKLDKEQRKRNVAGAFTVVPSTAGQISGNVLLIDDVLTSGQTLKACEQVLLEAGATRVYFLVVARAKIFK